MKRGIAALAGALISCASAPRPAVLSEADRTALAPGAQQAAVRAPEAFAHAEKLRRDADSAFHGDDPQAAQFLAERAIAAYQHAQVLGRVAIARERMLQASSALSQTQKQLGNVEAEQQRIAADADALELRIQVTRDAAPLASSGPVDAARESARLRAARSLALDGRLLCAAARLLGSSAPSLGAAETAMAELEKRLEGSPRPAPIDAAMRARASCLAALTEARRPASAGSSLGRSDQLLAELSAMGGLEPIRDERGVVVTLRAKAADARENEAHERLSSLARVAQAHPAFPLQVVVHEPVTLTSPSGPALGRGERVSAALTAAGVPPSRIWLHAAGAAHPIVDPALAGASGRNDRIEIVFVDPGG